MANVRPNASQGPPERDYKQAFDEAYAWYKTHLQELLPKYERQYVAILDGQVVDCDSSFENLARRIYAKYGYHDFLMPLVEAKPRVHRMPSVRVVR